MYFGRCLGCSFWNSLGRKTKDDEMEQRWRTNDLIQLDWDDTLISNVLGYSISTQSQSSTPDPRAIVRTRSQNGRSPYAIMHSGLSTCSMSPGSLCSSVRHRFGGPQSTMGLGPWIDATPQARDCRPLMPGRIDRPTRTSLNCFFPSFHWSRTEFWCRLQHITTKTFRDASRNGRLLTSRSKSHNLVRCSNGQQTGQPKTHRSIFLIDK
ncbi:hypothetical protein BJX76DRAFT_96979 [Aspergillus varians]